MKLRIVIAIAAAWMAGCASQNDTIRRLPAETFAGQDTDRQPAAPVAPQTVIPLTPADAPPMKTYDPWERLNRFTYRFNARFDEALFLPVADTYRRVPTPIRSGIHHFFVNLSEPKNFINYLLQLRPRFGFHSLGRFAINSTLGIAGLFDVAARFHLTATATGLGATLSTWGMHPGPYFVIPILGPSTLRDGIGLLGDYGTSYAINLADLYRGTQSWALGTVYAVDQRASSDFRYYASGSAFEYENIRFLYVHKELLEDEALHAKTPPKRRTPGALAGQ